MIWAYFTLGHFKLTYECNFAVPYLSITKVNTAFNEAFREENTLFCYLLYSYIYILYIFVFLQLARGQLTENYIRGNFDTG